MKAAFSAELATSKAKLDRERAKALRQQQQLAEQRKKLLEAHYAGAITLELLKSEQTRITQGLEKAAAKLAASDFALDTVESNLTSAPAWVSSRTATAHTSGRPQRSGDSSIRLSFADCWS